jgi:two-component system cell cycle sensor histidine kinase/response regulator CckA
MRILELIHNIALLVALAATFQVIGTRFDKRTITFKTLSGFLFGFVGLVGMMTPIHFAPGIFFDGRSIILSVAGLFGGPLVAAIASTMCVAYRLWLGGAGAWVGIAVILEAAAIGVVFHFVWKGMTQEVGPFLLWIFGLLVHVFMLALMLALPGGTGPEVLRHLGLPILVGYPLATALVCQIFADYERQLQDRRALAQSEARYRRFVETANEGVWSIDNRFRTTFVNEKTASMLGYKPEEMIGRALDSFIMEGDLSDHGTRMRAREQGANDIYERRIKHKSGSEIWALVSAAALMDDEGKFQGSFGMIADITEQKRMAEALRESEERFRAAFNSDHAVMLLIDQETGDIVDASPGACAYYGYDREALKKRNIADINAPEEALEKMRMAKAQQQKYFDFRHRLAGGEVRDVEVCAGPIVVAGKTLLFLIITDVTERKRAEERNLRLAAIVESSDDAIIGKTLDGIITSWNKGAEKIYGYEETEALGKPISLLVPSDRQDEIPEILEKIRMGEHVEHYETVRRKKDGSEVDVSLTISPIRGAEGATVGASTIARDVTELRQVQMRLEKERSQLRTLVQTIPDLVWLKDSDGVYLTCNHRFESFFGADESDIVGKTDYDFVDVDLADFFRDHDRKAMLADKPSTNEEWITFADDDHRELLETIKTPMYDKNGALIGVLGIGRNITELRKAEEAEKLLSAAIEQAAEAIFIADADGIIQYVNPAMADISGFCKEDLLGNPMRLLASDEYDATLHQQLWSSIKEGNIWSGRLASKKKDGNMYYEEGAISPVKDASGKTTNYVAVMRDITEHLKLSRQLQQAQKMEAIGTLAGGVAHDFNNLLTVVMGYSDLLLNEKNKQDPAYTDLQKIKLAAQKGADLVRRLLTFSRKAEFKPRPVDLNQQIEQLEKMLTRTIPKMVKIELRLADGLSRVNADPTQIDQVLMNLAVNASDAMPDGGRFIIETTNVFLDEEFARTHLGTQPGEYALLIISDTGCGMSRETVERIFEPFYTTKEAGKGTGLGLATVYGIVKQHNGYVTCYSEPGEGTTFRIYLPVAEMEIDLDAATTYAVPAFGTETILLADDEEFIRDLGEKILKRFGYTVLTTANGKEALDLYRREKGRISLVILDLIMPEMGGKQCLEELLQIDPDVKVIIASGYSAIGPTKESLEMGTKGFVNKPYDMRQVLEVVRRVLDET